MSDITQKQIAKILGVSHMTVHRALQNESSMDPNTRKKVLEACEKYHYRKSHLGYSLRKGNSLLIGVVAATHYSSLVTPILERLQFKMAPDGYNITIVAAEGEVQPADLEGLIAKRVDGIIITARCSSDTNHFLRESKIPVVYNVERPLENAPLCFVGSDDSFGTNLLMDHLFSTHHTRILLLDARTETYGGYIRKETYRQAMEKKTLPSMICKADGWSARHGYAAMINFLKEGRNFDALFAVGDSLAIGAIKALCEKGFRVPQDVAVAGYGNLYPGIIDYITPSLTTIAQPFPSIAENAVDSMIEMMGTGLHSETIILLEPNLIIRESTECEKIETQKK